MHLEWAGGGGFVHRRGRGERFAPRKGRGRGFCTFIRRGRGRAEMEHQVTNLIKTQTLHFHIDCTLFFSKPAYMYTYSHSFSSFYIQSPTSECLVALLPAARCTASHLPTFINSPPPNSQSPLHPPSIKVPKSV